MARALWVLVTVAVALLLAASATPTAHARLRTASCLAQKRKAWGTLRKCQGIEQAKQLQGKPGDPAKCLLKLQDALAKIDVRAAKAVIACRYGDNGDRTVTDYDTGLQWELKTGTVGGGCFLFDAPNCVNDKYNLADAERFVGGSSPDGTALTDGLAGFAGHSDWRLPTIVELRTIVDKSVSGCSSGSACIDPIFGPTAFGPSSSDAYLTSTTYSFLSDFAWVVNFAAGEAQNNSKVNGTNYVRAVRSGL